MAALFAFTPNAKPAPFQMKVIVPYTEGTEGFEACKLNLGILGIRPRLVKLERDISYDILFRKLWEEGEPFIIVEHDIVPYPGALERMWESSAPWCGFGYLVFGKIRSYLGCTKFVPKELGSCPLPDEYQSWQVMDRKIEAELIKRGFNGQIMEPPVAHLNFAHYRQTSDYVEHPRFWSE
jgi:hypothetical protein